MSVNRNFFTNLPVEYVIPKTTKVVFVCDFFTSDVQGGAELTTEAIMKKSPHRVFKVHSASLTRKMLDANKDKYFVLGNFASINQALLSYLPESGISYSIIEYDFKFCTYRSTNRHQQQTRQACNCAKDVHGLDITRLFVKAERIFWMSEGQKAHWLKNVPSLAEHSGQVTLSSVFDDATLDLLKGYRESGLERNPAFAVLGSGSWIKGVGETQKWCKLNRKTFEVIPNLPYQQFLAKLNTYQGLVFMPLDFDTCPRLTIEAKLMGLNLIMNENVLQKHDPWFTDSIADCDAYMRSRASAFWDSLPVNP